MSSRCDICLDEQCGGKRNCENCKVKSTCPRNLSPTIRITTKCTQSCRHCCWECSPKSNDFMSISVAKQIATFIKKNDINYCTIMGGEFFCHPEWKTILKIIIPTVKICRLVTNGDWGKNKYVSKFLSQFKENLLVSISEDNWHTNKYAEKAKQQCIEHGLKWNIPSDEMKGDQVLVPSGRLRFEPTSIFGLFATYCSNPDKK